MPITFFFNCRSLLKFYLVVQNTCQMPQKNFKTKIWRNKEVRPIMVKKKWRYFKILKNVKSSFWSITFFFIYRSVLKFFLVVQYTCQILQKNFQTKIVQNKKVKSKKVKNLKKKFLEKRFFLKNFLKKCFLGITFLFLDILAWFFVRTVGQRYLTGHKSLVAGRAREDREVACWRKWVTWIREFL